MKEPSPSSDIDAALASCFIMLTQPSGGYSPRVLGYKESRLNHKRYGLARSFSWDREFRRTNVLTISLPPRLWRGPPEVHSMYGSAERIRLSDISLGGDGRLPGRPGIPVDEGFFQTCCPARPSLTVKGKPMLFDVAGKVLALNSPAPSDTACRSARHRSARCCRMLAGWRTPD